MLLYLLNATTICPWWWCSPWMEQCTKTVFTNLPDLCSLALFHNAYQQQCVVHCRWEKRKSEPWSCAEVHNRHRWRANLRLQDATFNRVLWELNLFCNIQHLCKYFEACTWISDHISPQWSRALSDIWCCLWVCLFWKCLELLDCCKYFLLVHVLHNVLSC